MSKAEFEVVHSYSLHIDNGGITVDFGVYDYGDFKVPSVKFNTQYYGYTSITSELSGHELSPEVLRDISLSFIAFANELEEDK